MVMKELKHDMRKFWGALTSFQEQLHTINGTIDEVRGLMDEVLCDIKGMDDDLREIKKEMVKLK